MQINPQFAAAIESAFLQIKNLASGDSDVLRAEQNLALKDLLKQARKLKFWNSRLSSFSDSMEIEELSRQVPILTRTEIQENSGQLRIRVPNTSNSDYFHSRTSGSTGKPVEIMKFGPSEKVKSAAVTLLSAEWAHLDRKLNYARVRSRGEEEVAESWGFPHSLMGETGKSMTLDIIGRGARGVLEAAVEKEVGYIHANTTIMKTLAMEARDSTFQGNLPIVRALNWAERITLEDRNLIREGLGIDVWDNYSSEEFGAIAFQCPEEEHLHVLSFFTHIEIVDENGNPCQPGDIGRVIGTSLHSYSQPLIRYELGDLASFGERCDALPALPVINPEITRTRDTYITKSGVQKCPRIGKCRFLGYKNLRDYQIILLADAVLFIYSATTNLSASQVSEVKHDVGEQFSFDLPVQIRRVDSSEMFNHWKRKVFYKSDASFLGLESKSGRELIESLNLS